MIEKTPAVVSERATKLGDPDHTGFSGAQTIRVGREVVDLLKGDTSYAYRLLCKAADDPVAESNVAVQSGEHQFAAPAFNMGMAQAMRNFNVHHSACLETLPRLTFGMGFLLRPGLLTTGETREEVEGLQAW